MGDQEPQVRDVSGTAGLSYSSRIAHFGLGAAAAVDAPGAYAAVWDGTDTRGRSVSSGSYLYQLRIGNVFAATDRVTLLR